MQPDTWQRAEFEPSGKKDPPRAAVVLRTPETREKVRAAFARGRREVVLDGYRLRLRRKGGWILFRRADDDGRRPGAEGWTPCGQIEAHNFSESKLPGLAPAT